MIYLDADGPFVNWTQGVFTLYKGNNLSSHPKVKPGQNAAQALGITKTEMWSKIAKSGAKWWADLEPQPWARDFYQELSRIDQVMFLTSPSHIPDAHKGKVQFLHKFFGRGFRDYIMTKHKYLLAKPGDVLIDDHEHNTEAFTQAGGIGIVFPRLWNKRSKDSHRAVEKVLEDLSQVYPRYTPPHMVHTDDDRW